VRRGRLRRPAGCATRDWSSPNGTGHRRHRDRRGRHGGVDDAREIRERCGYAPVRTGTKAVLCVLVDEAQHGLTQGFNACSSSSRSHPSSWSYFLATTEPDRMLSDPVAQPTTTVRAGKFCYSAGVMRQTPRRICTDGGVTVEPAVRASRPRGRGSAPTAVGCSIADGGAGDAGVTYADAADCSASPTHPARRHDTTRWRRGDAASVYAPVDGVVEAGHNPRRFAADMPDRFAN